MKKILQHFKLRRNFLSLFIALISIVNAKGQSVVQNTEFLFDGTKTFEASGFEKSSTANANATATPQGDGTVLMLSPTTTLLQYRLSPSTAIRFNPFGDYQLEFRVKVTKANSNDDRGFEISMQDGVGKFSTSLKVTMRAVTGAGDATKWKTWPIETAIDYRLIKVDVSRTSKIASIYVDGALTKTVTMADETASPSLNLGVTNANGDFIISIDYIKLTGQYDATILPVNISTFRAIKSFNDIRLNWTTTSEVNNSHFIVEHSSNGQNFVEIGKVLAKGPSTYSFYHRNPSLDNYYRLKQFDYDGKSETFDVKYLKFDLWHTISIYPNIVERNTAINIKGVSNSKAELNVFDNIGKKLKSILIKSNNGISQLSTEGLNTGIYHIRLKDGNSITTHKLIIK